MTLASLRHCTQKLTFLLISTFSISIAIAEKFDDKIDGVADPCTDASLFWGDQALTADDVRRIFGREPEEVLSDLGQAAAHKRARNETAGKAELMKEIEQRDRRKKRAVTSLPERKWPHAVIPYEISSNFTSKQRSIFYQAMRHWELHTCVTFIEHIGRPEDPHILFTQRPCGCCSFVGRRGLGAQAISIGKNCDKFGIVVHELGHVVGFWHEHTRPDRDDYIKVVYENIQENQDYNFQKMPPNEIDSLQEPYDFDSIMHYSRNTFAKGAFMDTLRPIPQPGVSIKPTIGQRIKLSDGDKIQARKLYRCPSCGQTLQTPTGNFSSPGYPSYVKHDKQLHCEWRISTTPGETLEVNISDLGFASDANCHYDFLEIYDGPTLSDKLIGKYCRDNMPKRMSFTTTTHRMFVKYRKVSRRSDSVGFRMEYKAICGGTIMLNGNNNHEIVSPNNPDKYPPNSNCAWEVHAPPGYKIGLELNEFEVEQHESCTYDYLEVRDGATKNSPLIKKWCGFKAPDPIKSSGEKLFIEFKSDNNVNKGGFIANLIPEKDECLLNNGGCEQICRNNIGGFVCQCHPGFHLKDDGFSCETSCGGTLTSKTGEIVSPGFPKEYPPDKECLWMIVAPSDYKIILTFNHLDIEGTQGGCEYDYLELRSGLLETSPLLGGKICSVRTENMPSVSSTRNHMRVFFKSDASIGKTGFNVTYQLDIDECQKNNGGCHHLCVNEPGKYHCACRKGYTLHTDKKNCKEEPQCGSAFDVTEYQDKFYSPGYSSGRYPEKANCNWKLRTKDGHRIRIKWEEFDVEQQEDCGYDRVELSEQKRLVQKICRSSPHDYISRGNDVDVHFFSDGSIQKKGFKAVYRSECGGNYTVTDSERVIFSHASIGDKDYPTDADCTWTLNAPGRDELPGMATKVKLTYQMFQIEEEPTCKYDYLEVNSMASGLVEKRCGDGKPSSWPTSKPFVEILNLPVTLRFQSDGTITKRGFQIKYSLLQRRRNTMRHPNARN